MIPNITIHNSHGNRTNNPKLIVIHAMGEYILYKGKWMHAVEFLEKAVGLSAHFLVTPSGVGIRLRNDDESAWHAKGFNTDSLGIEFLVPGVYEKYREFTRRIKTQWLTDAAYEKGLQIVNYWLSIHEVYEVKTHSMLSPGRKVDPGEGFPKAFFHIGINHVKPVPGSR